MRFDALLRVVSSAVGLALPLATAIAQNVPAPVPEAQVTFYSTGNPWKGSIPGNKYGMFSGRIMDEYDQLAMLLPRRFITFHLEPGPHTFSANSWMVARPEGGGHLTLDLAAGKHYYVGVYLEQLVVWAQPRLEERPCTQAVKDNEKSNRLDEKHLKKYGKEKVLAEAAFPTCS